MSLLNSDVEQVSVADRPVVSTSQIILGVFAGMWLFAITAGIAWIIIKKITE